MAGVTLTASEIDLNTINKYLEYTNFLDLWDLVKPSYIGKKVTINPVDVLVRRGLSVEDAEAFLNSLTLNERQLISLAYADPMENEFLEENVLRVYNLDYDNYLNKKQGHQNNNDVSEGAGTIAAGGASGLPPDDEDDKNKSKTSSQTSKNDSEFQDKIDKSWDKGSFDSPEGSLDYHFNKHGKEVGATTPRQYLEKARVFADNLKGATKVNIKGSTENVVRYYKNGKYIDMVGKKIISFGKQ